MRGLDRTAALARAAVLFAYRATSAPGTGPRPEGTEGSKTEPVSFSSAALMNCREFRRKHDAYVDDTLSGVELDGMARHRQLCDRCAQLDTRVRRALLVARNLPTIHPSAAFGERLQARLAAERLSPSHRREIEDSLFLGRRRSFASGTYTIVAVGVLTVAGLAGAAAFSRAEDDVILLAPVVASSPEPEPSAFSAPTMVAAMPAGMPVWSAVFVAQQAPWHFASDAAGTR